MPGWTIDTLYVHLETLLREQDRRMVERFDAQEKALNAALASAALAVDKAEDAARRWRADANEWRQAMTDREEKFMSRTDAVARFENLSRQMSEVKEAQSSSSGRSEGINLLWAVIIGGLGVAVGVIALIVRF